MVHLRILPRQGRQEQLRVVPQRSVEEGRHGDGAQCRRVASAAKRQKVSVDPWGDHGTLGGNGFFEPWVW